MFNSEPLFTPFTTKLNDTREDERKLQYDFFSFLLAKLGEKILVQNLSASESFEVLLKESKRVERLAERLRHV